MIEESRGLVVGAFVLGGLALGLFVTSMVVPDEWRAHLGVAAQTATPLLAAAAALVAFHQFGLQRRALTAQQAATGNALKLQQDAINQQKQDSERAITEQHRVAELGRFADLRHEYARLLSAAYNVVLSTMSEPEPAIGSEWDKVQPPRPRHEGVWPEFQRTVTQLEMQDRSPLRSDIVRELWGFLVERHDIGNLAMQIRAGIGRLRLLGESLGGVLKDARIRVSDDATTDTLLGRDEALARTTAQGLTDLQMVKFRRDAIGFVRFALGASIAAEEAPAVRSSADATRRSA